MRTRWTSYFTENLSYKFVSLFIALILWLTILGRRDFVLTKSLEVEVVSRNEQMMVTQNVDSIKVKLSGPRTALKKFVDSGMSQLVTLDAGTREGQFEIEIPTNKLDVPFGVKVLSIRPSKVQVQVLSKSEKKGVSRE